MINMPRLIIVYIAAGNSSHLSSPCNTILLPMIIIGYAAAVRAVPAKYKTWYKEYTIIRAQMIRNTKQRHNWDGLKNLHF